MVAVTGDGTTLYTGDMGAGTVSRLDVMSRSKTRSYGVPATPEAITVSPDGSQVWVGSNAQGLVSVVDTETGEVDSRLAGFEWPYRILILADRDLVVIPDMGRSVLRFVSYSARSDVETLELPGEGPQGVALTRDRGTIFLSLSNSGQVAVIDLDTRRLVRRIDAGPSPDGIGWSPLVVR
jgi:DNA-binding beta-propeller fold protein YncE